ncbi:unnamed protein product [Symbiodinium necroappetens]|uniref:Uncharacterized protein n=1 Tax=Symbiodinium necroappetens TaxID=1628268 RepID=A0A812NMB5_9DINO|nr:unnamed protein product [Symbiodinium necroappetens]
MLCDPRCGCVCEERQPGGTVQVDLAELLRRGSCATRGVPAEAVPPEIPDGAGSPTFNEESLLAKQKSHELCHEPHQVRAGEEGEEERRQQEAMNHHARLQSIAVFLKKHGFSGINVPKRGCFRKTFALHKAAELADVATTTLLLAEGADVSLRNSSGRTAADVAKKIDNCGSHAAVFNLLVEAPKPCPP